MMLSLLCALPTFQPPLTTHRVVVSPYQGVTGFAPLKPWSLLRQLLVSSLPLERGKVSVACSARVRRKH